MVRLVIPVRFGVSQRLLGEEDEQVAYVVGEVGRFARHVDGDVDKVFGKVEEFVEEVGVVVGGAAELVLLHPDEVDHPCDGFAELVFRPKAP